jgi:hypothetical protein
MKTYIAHRHSQPRVLALRPTAMPIQELADRNVRSQALRPVPGGGPTPAIDP